MKARLEFWKVIRSCMTEIAVCNITRTIFITLKHSRHSALKNCRSLVLITITLNDLIFLFSCHRTSTSKTSNVSAALNTRDFLFRANQSLWKFVNLVLCFRVLYRMSDLMTRKNDQQYDISVNTVTFILNVLTH